MLQMAPMFPALGLLLLLTTPAPTSGLCSLQHNGTLAQCHSLEDIPFINTYELKSLKVTYVGKHLSASVFGNITTLQHLDLSHGKLRRIEPGTFSKLENLRSLDLSHNHLTHLGHGTFEGPAHLRVLNLRQNSLVRIPVDAVDLKDLKFLELSSNKLNCTCKTLKTRDVLISQGVIISTKSICAGPGNMKGVILTEPDAEVICKFEKQDQDPGMQKDQPESPIEGSGDLGSGDPFDELEDEDIPEENDPVPVSEPETPREPEETTPAPIAVSLTTASIASPKDEELFFTEEVKHPWTSAIPSPTVPTTSATTASEFRNNPDGLTEGSGDDEYEGSGIESSGHRVPPITWDNIKEEQEVPDGQNPELIENATPNPITTTTSAGLFDGLFGLFSWGSSDTTTSAPPTTSTVKELGPEDEGFIGVSESEKPAIEEPIIPNSLNPVEGEKKPNEPTNERVLLNLKPEEAAGETPVVIGGTQTAGASATTETKKGMGSYVVLGILLGVLVALIGVAAYKGDFCKKARKRNSRGRDGNDVENGTELKDLRKSLLETTNSVQPKISSNGSKSEAMPLVTCSIPEEIRSDEEPTAKFVGAVPESSADPIKPPRKSFSPQEPEIIGPNGKVSSIEDLGDCPIAPVHSDHLVNGKNNRDSMCSAGESPSSESVSNHRLSNPSPSSPGAQRVKITMQDNPDSVPKTPLLITRTRGGENLVKTP